MNIPSKNNFWIEKNYHLKIRKCKCGLLKVYTMNALNYYYEDFNIIHQKLQHT